MNPTISAPIKPKAVNFIYELERELNSQNMKKEVLDLFKAVLHAMRDKMPNRDAILLLSGLPSYLKPIFWEGWKPSQNSVTDVNFIELVYKYAASSGSRFIQQKDIEENVKKVFWMIENKLPLEKRLIIKASIPAEINIYL